MSGEPLILIVDNNIAFATLLKEGLEQGGEYRAIVMSSGEEAVEVASAAEFDLAVVDMGLTDPDGLALARALREKNPSLRLMLIPLDGADLPPNASDLDVQGVLTKPFFLPELSGHVADALAKPLREAAVPAPGDDPDDVRAEPTDKGPDQEVVEQVGVADVVQKMAALAQEVNAEAVILTSGERLIAHTGRLSTDAVNGLAQAVAESWLISNRVAQILGQEQLRFEQSSEGGEHLFYSLAIAGDVILSLAIRASVPLGMIRHRTKTTADALQELVGAAR
jgi:CheY-like chemotaxis protein